MECAEVPRNWSTNQPHEEFENNEGSLLHTLSLTQSIILSSSAVISIFWENNTKRKQK